MGMMVKGAPRCVDARGMPRLRHISELLAGKPTGENNRKAGRLKCELIQCELGEVLDLSRSGMRVKSKSRSGVNKGEAYSLTIVGPGSKVTVGGRVVWLKKNGLFGAELGIEFISIPAEAAHEFARLVRTIMA